MTLYPLLQFWNTHRCLLLGCSFLLGISVPHGSFPNIIAIPLFLLFIPLGFFFFIRKEFSVLFISSLIIFFAGVAMSATRTSVFELPAEKISGTATIHIQNVRHKSTIFGEKWVYRCFVLSFIPEEKMRNPLYNFPCEITLPYNEGKHPNADCDYHLLGQLTQNELGNNILKVSTKTPWIPIEKSFSYAEMRANWKRKVSAWIASVFPHQESAQFITGLSLGEFDDAWMREQFSRFGVQHLLAISGFHFIIIASFFGTLLRIFLPLKFQVITLISILSLYCAFLGPQPSILRAYIMSTLPLIALLFGLQNHSLNALGVSLLIILLIDPLAYRDLGFQLSFATAASILLFYTPSRKWVECLFPKRKLSDVIQMSHKEQWGVCILGFLRDGLGLSIAVNIAALPLTLYYFGSFAWMGLFYNLFYPIAASFAVIMFLIGILFLPIPPIASCIFHFNDLYTLFLLKLVTGVPHEIDFFLKTEAFTSFSLVALTSSLFCIGIFYYQKNKKGSSHK